MSQVKVLIDIPKGFKLIPSRSSRYAISKLGAIVDLKTGQLYAPAKGQKTIDDHSDVHIHTAEFDIDILVSKLFPETNLAGSVNE